MSDFRSLIVWQKAMDLAKQIYIISKKIPDEERFGLIGQMRRCAVSIASNIAEGSKRGSKKEFSQFLRVSSGSAAELETQLLLSKNLYSIETDKEIELLKEVQKMLESLMRKL